MGSDTNIPTRDLDDAGRRAERRRPAPRVLLIDDDPTTRNIVSHFLRKEDLVVIKASSGSDGLEMARNDRPDLLIVDAAVAGVNGLELLSLLEREPETRDLPVLLLSSLDDEDDHRQEPRCRAPITSSSPSRRGSSWPRSRRS